MADQDIQTFRGTQPMSDDGLITLRSEHTVNDTIDRLENELAKKGISVFARIDHAAGAASMDASLRPTLLLIFGSPKGGTPLMQSVQRSGIDLPLKMLAWQDETGGVWLAYNDMKWLAHRHRLTEQATPAVEALAQMLAALADAAVG